MGKKPPNMEKFGERGERSRCLLSSRASTGPAERYRDLNWVMLSAQKGLESETLSPQRQLKY